MSVIGRLKEGNLSISGELNERIPAVTDGLVVHYPFDNTYLPSYGTDLITTNNYNTLENDGLVFEENTTNLLVNPTLDNNGSGWYIDNYVSRTKHTFIKFDDFYKIQFTYDTTVGGTDTSFGIKQSLNISANTAYTYSVYIEGSKTLINRIYSSYASVQMYLQMNWYTDSTLISSTTEDASIFHQVTDNIIRVIITATSPENANRVQFQCDLDSPNLLAGEYCNIFKPQLEAKAYATSFVNGSRYNGQFAMTYNFTPPYTINVYHKSYYPLSLVTTQATSPGIFQLGNYYANASISLWNFIQHYLIHIKGDTGSGWSSATSIISFASNTWDNVENMYTFVAVDNNNFKVYFNGLYIKTCTSAIDVTNINTFSFYVPGGKISDAKYRDLSIYNKALSDEEVSKLYNNKFSIQSNGDINNVEIIEKSVIPSDAFYFPLNTNTNDINNIVTASESTNVSYNDGVWVGTATTNLIHNPSMIDTSDNITPLYWSKQIVKGSPIATWEEDGINGRSLKISAPTTDDRVIWHAENLNTPIANQVYTLSGWLDTPGLASGFLQIQETITGPTYAIHGASYTGKTKTGKNNKTWYEVAVTFTTNSNVTGWTWGVRIDNSNNNGTSKAVTFQACDIQLETKAFVSNFVNGSIGASSLEYNFNSSIGLDWNGNWSLCYWKKPVGTLNSTLTHYNIESLGCNSNSVGGGYMWFGKDVSLNVARMSLSATTFPFTHYFNKWHMISLVKSNLNLTFKFWGIDNIINTLNYTYSGTKVSNYYVNQYGYDFKMSGYDNVSPCNTYFKDLVVIQRALTDAELTNMYKVQLRSINDKKLIINNKLIEDRAF